MDRPETYEARLLRQIHENREKLKQNPEAQEVRERIKHLIDELLKLNSEHIIPKKQD
jgi:hypothetical protein